MTHSANGYWNTSQTDPRQFGLAVTPPLLKCSIHEPPRAVCSAPSCSHCTVMTALPDIKRKHCLVCITGRIINNDKGSYREEINNRTEQCTNNILLLFLVRQHHCDWIYRNIHCKRADVESELNLSSCLQRRSVHHIILICWLYSLQKSQLLF